jgi:hypothetical protein
MLHVPFYFPLVNDADHIAIETALAIGARRGLNIEIIVALLASLLSSAAEHPFFEHARS